MNNMILSIVCGLLLAVPVAWADAEDTGIRLKIKDVKVHETVTSTSVEVSVEVRYYEPSIGRVHSFYIRRGPSPLESYFKDADKSRVQAQRDAAKIIKQVPDLYENYLKLLAH